MAKLTRRAFIGTSVAAAGAARRGVARLPAGRRILTLVYDKSLGMMRAVERIVP